MRLAWLLILGACGCGRVAFDVTVDGPARDASPDAFVLGAWSNPTPVAITGNPFDDPSMTLDGLELYMNQGPIVLASTRATTADPWSPPLAVAGLPATFYSPHISGDGLTLWGVIQNGTFDIAVATRTTRQAPWTMTTTVLEVSSTTSDDDGPAVTSDRLTMVVESQRNGPRDVFLASRTSTLQPWSTPTPVMAITAAGGGGRPHITDDRLAIYFEAAGDIWITTRASTSDAFGTPHVVSELSSPQAEQDPWISADQRHAIFGSNRSGQFQLWESFR